MQFWVEYFLNIFGKITKYKSKNFNSDECFETLNLVYKFNIPPDMMLSKSVYIYILLLGSSLAFLNYMRSDIILDIIVISKNCKL